MTEAKKIKSTLRAILFATVVSAPLLTFSTCKAIRANHEYYKAKEALNEFYKEKAGYNELYKEEAKCESVYKISNDSQEYGRQNKNGN